MANDGSGHVDLSMEGGDPIRPRPEEIQNMNAQFEATVDAKVDGRGQAPDGAVLGAERDTAVAAATADRPAHRGAVLATLGRE